MCEVTVDLVGNLERIRSAVRGMEYADDWQDTVSAVGDELRRIGVQFAYASVLLVDLEAGTMHGFGVRQERGCPYPVSKGPLKKAVRRALVRQEVVYRRDLELEDPFDELCEVRDLGIRSVIDIPFCCGTLGLSNKSPEAFPPAQVTALRQIAQVLSYGCQRAADLGKLQQRNRHLEQEIIKRRSMEQELVRTQRLSAVGALSAGISHNLNNILTGVLGPAQLLERMTDDAEMLEQIRAIIAASRRARDLVYRLGQSVRGVNDDQLGPVSLTDAIRVVLREMRPGWQEEPEPGGSRMRVELHLEEVPLVRVVPAQLQAVLSNLLFNAVEAMPEGGTITIGTHADGEVVWLVFADDGRGMDEATQRRLFEPFNSTRRDVGSGLGLATVHAMVTGWGGSVAVESQIGQGTRFTMGIPVWVP